MWVMDLLAMALWLCIVPTMMQKSLTSNLSSCCVASVDTMYLKHFFCNMCPWFFLCWFWPLKTKCDGLSIIKKHACIVLHSLSWILVLHPRSSKYYISTVHWEHIAPHFVSSPMAKVVSAIVIFALPLYCQFRDKESQHQAFSISQRKIKFKGGKSSHGSPECIKENLQVFQPTQVYGTIENPSKGP